MKEIKPLFDFTDGHESALALAPHLGEKVVSGITKDMNTDEYLIGIEYKPGKGWCALIKRKAQNIWDQEWVKAEEVTVL